MNVLFVCSGNTCRSPMASGIFKKILTEKNLNKINVFSAGTFAKSNSCATENAIKACKEIGVDISNHLSRSIFDVNINEIDKFIVMTQMHRDFLIDLGVKREKIFILGKQILDPFGGDLEVYKMCRDQICNALNEFVEREKND